MAVIAVPLTPEEIDRRFKYHPPTPTTVPKHEVLREEFIALANLVNDTCPPSDEAKTAILGLQNALFWANAAIACNQP